MVEDGTAKKMRVISELNLSVNFKNNVVFSFDISKGVQAILVNALHFSFKYRRDVVCTRI